MMKSDVLMEICWAYKKGWINLDNAIAQIVNRVGLSEDVADSFLKGLPRENVVRLGSDVERSHKK